MFGHMECPMRYLLALALLAVSPCAWSQPADQSAVLMCSPPMENTDGSPITDMLGYRFYRSATSGGPYALVADVPVCEFEDNGLDRGTTYFWVATAYNESGEESEFSNEASAMTASPEPAAPQNLVVDAANLTAFTLVQSRDRIALLPVGTVAVGTACSSQRVLNTFVVPRDAVTFAGSVMPEVVTAQCGAF